jgi:hypothetical protein
MSWGTDQRVPPCAYYGVTGYGTRRVPTTGRELRWRPLGLGG